MVVKWPRFAFEKFPGADGTLSTSMQSVGEAMAIGRTFKQAFVKAMRSRELDVDAAAPRTTDELLRRLETPVARPLRADLRGDRRGRLRGRALRAHRDRPLVHGRDRARSRAGEDPEAGLERSFKAVDTCAAEFEAETPYFYSGWERRAVHEVSAATAPRW